MKYCLNKLPVKTTNNFKINDLEVEFDIPNFQMNHEFEIQGDTSSLKIDKKFKKEKITSKIGLELEEFYEISITVPRDVCIEDPIMISYSFENDESVISKFQFLYEENSSCNFILSLNSLDSSSCFSHLVEEVQMKENSKGDVTFLNLLNPNSKCFYAMENEVSHYANLSHTIIDLGGNTRVYNAFGNSLGTHSENRLNTIYIGKRNDLLDFNYYYKNIGKESNNQIRVEGAIDDECKKNFRGTIDFLKDCTGSVGEENENCILLSDTCRSRSLPQMLCEEENVVGSHGVSSGKVSSDKLFYIMSRGYSEKEAEKLIVLANFMSILNTISSSDLQEVIQNKIEELLA